MSRIAIRQPWRLFGASLALSILIVALAAPRGDAILASTASDAIVGQASVIDADTIEIHGERVRLEGIDAPESGQRCRAPGGGLYRCGAVSANALADWIGEGTVSCIPSGKDRYGRMLAHCSVRGADLGGWLVEEGYALAYRRYSHVYVEAESLASDRKLGIWSGEFVAPWDWRRGARLTGEKPTKAMLEGRIAAR
ncbi:thermonuclease family protein [bacterium]|nr:thermonuclease family protein [bacterium]